MNQPNGPKEPTDLARGHWRLYERWARPPTSTERPESKAPQSSLNSNSSGFSKPFMAQIEGAELEAIVKKP